MWQPILLGMIGLSLSACATVPRSCLGMRTSGLADVDLGNERTAVALAQTDRASVAELRCSADRGVTAAQVALAARYEVGDGVPRDVGRAARLYEQAAMAIPANTAIYSPPVKIGGSGRVLFIPNPNAGPGSAEAQYRLGRLLTEGRGVPLDLKRGRKLIERAAQQGYPPGVMDRSK